MATRFVPLSSIDRLATGLLSGARLDRQIPLDAYQRGEALVLELDLPGVAEDDVELSLERRVLTVRAERPYSAQEAEQVFVAERPWGTLSRQIVLGESLDVNRVHASFERGVLRVTVPVAETAKSRRIEIRHAPVNAESSESVEVHEPEHALSE